MKPKRKYKARYFPFSPGIPWKIERGKYVIPEIDFETWHKILDGRNIIITAFGGLLESFLSLSAVEAILSIDSAHKVYWLGNQEYSFLVRLQGLCKISLINLTKETLKQYPVPLFLDGKGNAYLNVLNNYMQRTSYWGKYPEEVTAPVVEQISRNIMIPWESYAPKLRNLGTEFIDELQKTGRIRQISKIISIILNETNKDLLKWSLQNFKEFSQLASHKGWKVIVFTNNTNLFHGSNILAVEYNPRHILQVIKKSWVIMSNDINWSLMALMISEAKLISKPIDNQYSLFKNAEFLGANNDIFTDRNLYPIDVFGICEGL
ncbi:hypothetical protein M0R72_02465 [Candidatus Pacearchaeota archaeon]|jgi:hypothetical protein|nr:hypothetical protein [Candidatus Pacearchaeota archaeon]